MVRSNLLTVPEIKPRKNWAKIPDDIVQHHRFDDPEGPVWCPVIAPGIVRSDIRLAKREGTDNFQDYGRINRVDAGMLGIVTEYEADADWILYVGDEVLTVGNDRDSLRDLFDRQYRWMFIRPPALKLVPDDDEIEEILANVVHPKVANAGDFVLRYHLGPILDVALIRKVNKTRTKFEILGDTLTLELDDFLPPTKYRKSEYTEGIKKLRAPVAAPLPPLHGDSVFPEHPSSCIPSKPTVRIEVMHGTLSGNYFWFDFVVTNQGAETINTLHYQWARNSNIPKEKCPFAYQNNEHFTVFSLRHSGFKLYPSSNERVSVCVGKNVGAGELNVFIPEYYFGGRQNSYFRLTHDVVSTAVEH